MASLALRSRHVAPLELTRDRNIRHSTNFLHKGNEKSFGQTQLRGKGWAEKSRLQAHPRASLPPSSCNRLCWTYRHTSRRMCTAGRSRIKRLSNFAVQALCAMRLTRGLPRARAGAGGVEGAGLSAMTFCNTPPKRTN